ncbi:MAG: DUF2085 domain-containing protein [Chloroflexota bacterium]|nr:DUF2085 domain-containing protein [Chloroflexota bacterium]
MKVTLYTRVGCAECKRVWDMLVTVAAHYDLTLDEAASPEGAPAPCVRLDAPNSPFYDARGLDETKLAGYVATARQSMTYIAGHADRAHTARRPGSAPTAAEERRHPIRAYLWRHRVGAMISAISLFIWTAWAAPLTVSLGLGNGFYNAVHSAYRLVCDQVPERSAMLGGLPVCLCWRCTAIYAGSLLFGVIYTLGRDHHVAKLNWLTQPVSLLIMLLYGLPLILDGASHALGLRAGLSLARSPDFWLSWQTFSADWLLRIATSLLATVGAVKFICPRLDKIGTKYERLYRARAGLARRATGPAALGTGTAAQGTSD